jgi:pimeloyl-ACP methyl ester carboxylesterase
VLTATASDGTSALAYDEGQGPAILLLHPGLDDGRRCKGIARILAGQGYRVLRLHRRQYRLDLPKCTVAEEVEHVLAVVEAVGRPLLLYGHSDGGVIALESLVAAPGSFAGAVIFEPSSVVDTLWGGPDGAVITRARAALAAGRVGKAMEIFTRDATGLPGWQAWVVGLLTAMIPRYRRLVPPQINSLEAMDQLGPRLDAYAGITVPTVLLGGGRTQARITRVVDAVARTIPNAERVVLPRRDHGADLKAPNEVAGVISTLAGKVLR